MATTYQRPPTTPQRDRSRGGNLGAFDPERTTAATGRTEPSPPRWRYLLYGIACAWPVAALLPSMFLWVLCALPHEMGHATVGCLLGHPSTPAISLAGHAWTGIGELRPWLVWVMAASLAVAAAGMRRRPMACVLLGALAVLVPLCAFHRVSEVLIAAGGHLGELAFATWCFEKAWTGGRTDTVQERIGSAIAGALVQFANLRLCFGLLNSPAAREVYASNGSLGMKNDYLVLSEDLLGCGLGTVVLVMFVLALLPLPLGALLGAWRERVADRTGGPAT